MQDLIDYLGSSLGESPSIIPYAGKNELPLFLQNEYDVYDGTIHGISVLFIRPKAERLSIERLKKHLKGINEYTEGQPVLWLEGLRSVQRSKLVINRIPFVVAGLQMYLPFLYLNFKEQVVVQRPSVDFFTVATQCVYLHLLLHPREYVSASKISMELHVSVMTATRALRDLEGLKLVTPQGAATRKKYQRIEKRIFWEKGLSRLVTPLMRKVYTRRLPTGLKWYISGESALAHLSMMNEPPHPVYAIYKKNLLIVKEEDILLMDELDDMDYQILEIWKYDPALFSKIGIVDLFSLFASLQKVDEPRQEIEMSALLEEILCRE